MRDEAIANEPKQLRQKCIDFAEENRKLRSKIERLRAALTPFAALGDNSEVADKLQHTYSIRTRLTIEHAWIREARDALAAEAEKGGEE